METAGEAKKTAAESARDARRRKILERGTDRLAFITSQTRSVPSSPSSAPAPSPPAIPEQQLPRSTFAEPSKNGSDLSKHAPSNEATGKVYDIGVELFAKHEKKNEPAISAQQTSGDSERFFSSVIQSSPSDTVDTSRHAAPRARLVSPVTQTMLNDTIDTSRHVVRRANYQLFTPKRITSSVSSSENIRLICAATIALLVVLSYRGYSVGGQVLTGVITFRPIYLVLLTDATIVLWLLLANQEPEKHEETRQIGREESDLADTIGRSLELGLVLQKAVRSVFMDCCVCAVIMIIGIPFGAKGVI